MRSNWQKPKTKKLIFCLIGHLKLKNYKMSTIHKNKQLNKKLFYKRQVNSNYLVQNQSVHIVSI